MAKGNRISATKMEDDWQVESDLRTLMEAEKIEKDPTHAKLLVTESGGYRLIP